MPVTAGDKLVCVCNFIMITMFVYNRICVLTKLWKFERRRPSAVIGCLRRCICLTSVVNAFRTGLSDGKQFVMVGGARQKIELNKPIAVGFTIRLAVIVIIKRRHTLAWKGILVSVVFFLCPVTDISAKVAPIGVKFCMMVHIGPGQLFSPFGGGAPTDPQNPKFWV